MSTIQKPANDPMQGYEPSRAMSSIADWIRRTVEAAQPITPEKALVWAAAFDAAGAKAGAQLALARLEAPADRVSAQRADALLAAALTALARVTDHAQQAATRSELQEIHRDVTSIVNALECLAVGVTRPTQPNGDDYAG